MGSKHWPNLALMYQSSDLPFVWGHWLRWCSGLAPSPAGRWSCAASGPPPCSSGSPAPGSSCSAHGASQGAAASVWPLLPSAGSAARRDRDQEISGGQVWWWGWNFPVHVATLTTLKEHFLLCKYTQINLFTLMHWLTDIYCPVSYKGCDLLWTLMHSIQEYIWQLSVYTHPTIAFVPSFFITSGRDQWIFPGKLDKFKILSTQLPSKSKLITPVLWQARWKTDLPQIHGRKTDLPQIHGTSMTEAKQASKTAEAFH